MNLAALKVYQAIRRDGTQKNVLGDMQTRDDLYKYLDYHAYEQKLDALFSARRRRSRNERHRIAAPAFKPKKSVALSGVTAGNTALCTVGRSGNDLHYRGYDILEVAETCEFEEIAYLLIHGKLPNVAELAAYKAKLKNLRGIPAPVRAVLEQLPPATHPMDVLRTGASALGCVLPEADDHDAAGAREIADHLLASFGSMLCYWYHFSHSSRRIHVETDDDSVGGHFLHLLHRRAPSGELGARHAHLADSLRRARVQLLHVHRARDRRHGLGHLFLHHRRHRRVARTQTRRRQRSGAGDPGTLRHAGRGRGGYPPARGEQGDRHRLRSSGVHRVRSAQRRSSSAWRRSWRARPAT